MKINFDKLNNAAPDRVATCTYNVLDRLQHFEPHVQVMGACATFAEICERFKVDPYRVFIATKNMMNTKEGRRAEFLALKDYAKYEL